MHMTVGKAPFKGEEKKKKKREIERDLMFLLRKKKNFPSIIILQASVCRHENVAWGGFPAFCPLSVFPDLPCAEPFGIIS